MKIAIYTKPSGQFLAVPVSETTRMWQRDPLLVIEIEDSQMSHALLVLTRDWNQEGSLGNVFSKILTAVFEAGARYQANRSAEQFA